MSSIKPTISANGALRVGVAALLAGAALLAAYGAGRDLLGQQALRRGQAALAQAVGLPRGAARDSALERARAIADNGVDYAPLDPDLWNLLGETRLLQATTAALEAVSGDLLNASVEASARAARLAPKDPTAPARIAYVRSLQQDEQAAVGAALAQSYAAAAFEPGLGLRRVESAGRAWSALSEPVRTEVLLEACQVARQGKTQREALYDIRMGDADAAMALAIDRIMADPSCAIRD